jgi:hypothetical protein
MFKLKQRPTRIGMLAFHFSYNQTFIPVQGVMVLVVAPPPRNRDADPAVYEVDYERIAAFVVEPGSLRSCLVLRFKNASRRAFTTGDPSFFREI